MEEALFSTGKNDWETPQDFFNEWDNLFHFTIDVCATEANHKCDRYYSPTDNGLIQDWQSEIVWCNPPYSAKEQDLWVKKCWEEGQKPNTTVVALLPARTDTKRFHQYIYNKAQIHFIKGRLKFVGADNSAPFPSMIVIWRQE